MNLQQLKPNYMVYKGGGGWDMVEAPTWGGQSGEPGGAALELVSCTL